MTVKFPRNPAAPNYFKAPPDSAFAFPAGGSDPVDWCIGAIITFDGNMAGTALQYLLSTGPSGSGGSGSLNFMYFEDDGTTDSSVGKMGVWTNTIGSAIIKSAYKPKAGETWAYFIENTGTTLKLYRGPILSAMPTTGADIVTEGSYTRSAVLSGPNGLSIGARADLDTNRLGDQSIGRVWRVNRALTALEKAKICHGMEITEVVGSPVFYYPLDTVTDFANEGTSTVQLTKTGNPTTSTTQPAFGYGGAQAGVAPSIAGTPTLSGTVQVGSTVSVVPAPTSGTPAPTNTYEHHVNNIVVGSSQSYTFQAADTGKPYTARQIATNGVGTPASADSATSAVAASPSVTLTATPITPHRIFQRQPNSATIPVTLAYSGADPTSAEYQVLDVADSTTVRKAWAGFIAPTIIAGSITGNVIVPQGGMYVIQYRIKNGTSVTATSSISESVFGVGDLFSCIGSSSAERWFTVGAGGAVPAANVRQYENEAGGWQVFTVGAAIRIANSLAAQSGVPVGLIASGANGTELATWATSATNYKTAIAEVGGKLAGVLVSVGSNDADSATVIPSAQSHLNLMNTLASKLRTEVTGQPDLPIFWSGMNRRNNTARVELNAGTVRAAENMFGDQPNCYHIVAIDFELSTDKIHLTTAGFTAQGDRIGHVVGNVLYTGGGYKRGPKITSIGTSGSSATITVSHRNGSDLTPAVDITGFVGYNGSGTVINTISAVRTTSATIFVTFSEPVSRVTYLDGGAPSVTAAVFDNGTVPLPLHPETILQADVVTAPSTTRNVAYTLGDANGAAANLTGMMVSFCKGTGPHNTTTVFYQSSTETTNSTGVLAFTFDSSEIAVGEFGILSVLLPDGRHFLGKVVVS